MKVQSLDSLTVAIDETNIHENNKPEFAAFAGLAISTSQLGALRENLLRIKVETGYPIDLPIKYNHKKGEKFRSHFKREDLNSSVIETLRKLGAKFFVNIIHNGIIRPGAYRSLKMNILITIATAEEFLATVNREGSLVIDRMPYFERKDQARVFTEGISFLNSKKRLKMVTSIAEAHVDTHPLLQGLDVVLGCFQNWINKPKPCFVENCLMEKLSALTWTHALTGDPFEHGIKLRPLQLKSACYLDQYSGLETRLREILTVVPKDEVKNKAA